MADKKQKKSEAKLILEREYIVPLRKGWLKVPKYKRAKKAIKTLKEFLVKHMKAYDRDLRKIKIDISLNNEIRFRGMKKPPAKIKIKAKKFDNGIVNVELVNIPAHIKFAKLREEKIKTEIKKKEETTKSREETSEKPLGVLDEETKEAIEKEQASKEEGLKLAKQEAKEMKHISKEKNMTTEKKARANLQR